MKKVVQDIKDLFASKGQLHYGEDVTQQEHAVQCYLRASETGADVELRVASFLHDIGHLIYDENLIESSDLHHEKLASKLLANWGFSEKVVCLVDSHVWAKRYLVTNEPYYINRLSAASLSSLLKQGGLMSEEETIFYRKFPYFDDCLKLRRWDDEGKRYDIVSKIPEEVWADIDYSISHFPAYSGF